VEAGHRCAIPTCRACPVEIAHIVPWSDVREHTYENLIALCPTCHARYDRGDIDRSSMRQYKNQLQLQGTEETAERAIRLEAFCNLAATLHNWHTAINSLVIADLEEEAIADPDDPAARRAIEISREIRSECTAAWNTTQIAMSRFRMTSDDEFFRLAEYLYNRTKSWADHVIDGLWPSTHQGADQHDDLWELESDLFEYASIDLRVSEDDLIVRTGRTWRENATQLGGTGKRF
jgi:HNH endonuclease